MAHNTKKWLGIAATALALSVGTVQVAWAVDAVTTSPTKVYAAVGDTFSFTVTLPAGNPTSDTDLLVSYTANTTSPSITPYALCIDAATPAPYNGAPPNTKYVNWSAGVGIFPSAPACGAQAGAITLATFSGVAATIPGGKYTVQVLNGFANADPNIAANDVTVCQKRTVNSVTAPANFTEGAGGNFVITLDQAVVAGCGGFSVPYTLSGAAVAGKGALPLSGICTFADAATTCNAAVTTVDNTTFEGSQALVLTVTDSTATSSYVSAGKNATVTVLDNETAPVATAPTISALANATLTGGTGSVAVNVATTGTATASVALSCTIPAGTAAFAVTSGAARTINAPATVGANAPAIGLSCTPQATLQTATLSCSQTTIPAPNPAALTATITCPAVVVVVPAVTAATPPGPVTLPSYSVASTPTSSSTTLNFNTSGGASSLVCTTVGAGYSATPSSLPLTVGSTGVLTVTYTGAVVGTFTGTLTCTPTGPATGGPFVYNLSTTVQAAPVIGPTVQVPTMGTFGLGLMGLLIAGFAGFMQRRRVK